MPDTDDTPLTTAELLTRAKRLVESMDADRKEIAARQDSQRWSAAELMDTLATLEVAGKKPASPSFFMGDRVEINDPRGLNGRHGETARVVGPAYDGDARYATVEFEDGVALCWPVNQFKLITAGLPIHQHADAQHADAAEFGPKAPEPTPAWQPTCGQRVRVCAPSPYAARRGYIKAFGRFGDVGVVLDGGHTDGALVIFARAHLELDVVPTLMPACQPAPQLDAASPIDSSTQPDAEIERHVANVFAGLRRRPVVGDVGCTARRPVLHKAAGLREADIFEDVRDDFGYPVPPKGKGDGFVA